MGKQDVYKQTRPILYNANLDERSLSAFVGSIEEAKRVIHTMRSMGWRWVRIKNGAVWNRFVHKALHLPHIHPWGDKWRCNDGSNVLEYPGGGADFDSPIACAAAAAAILFQREAMWVDCLD